MSAGHNIIGPVLIDRLIGIARTIRPVDVWAPVARRIVDRMACNGFAYRDDRPLHDATNAIECVDCHCGGTIRRTNSAAPILTHWAPSVAHAVAVAMCEALDVDPMLDGSGPLDAGHGPTMARALLRITSAPVAMVRDARAIVDGIAAPHVIRRFVGLWAGRIDEIESGLHGSGHSAERHRADQAFSASMRMVRALVSGARFALYDVLLCVGWHNGHHCDGAPCDHPIGPAVCPCSVDGPATIDALATWYAAPTRPPAYRGQPRDGRSVAHGHHGGPTWAAIVRAVASNEPDDRSVVAGCINRTVDCFFDDNPPPVDNDRWHIWADTFDARAMCAPLDATTP